MRNEYDLEGFEKFLAGRYHKDTARIYLRPIRAADNSNLSLADLSTYDASQLAILVQKKSRGGSKTSTAKKYRSGVLAYLQYLRIIGAES